MSNEVTFPAKAEIVIIGAGIVGCSIAYHLASKKIKNVVLVEQDKWPEPGGSTSHASDFIFPIDHSELMAKLSKYGVELYSSLKFNGKPCYEMVGGIEIARTEERLRELQRKVASGKSWGIEAELISGTEAQSAFPFLETELVRGAMWTRT
ncbi:MAG: FAD-dependent oxidoreductase, partial [Chloroflexota bacterium]|nr:FAD-dependent oxidoreductase [Chloroflexota bacterium]